jgi:hypothetical protein
MREKRTIYIVTKSADRLKFEDIQAMPSQGGALTVVNMDNLDFAINTFSNYCAALDAGCVQIFDAVDRREFGYFHI